MSEVQKPMQHIQTSDSNSDSIFKGKLYIPGALTHKGQNGRVLIIGGSELFHSSILWSAEIASHFVDMVHFASTEENNRIFEKLKEHFRNGIIIPRLELDYYAQEDEAILIGPGMVRREGSQIPNVERRTLEQIIKLKDEGELTRELTKYLIQQYPNKRFVIDAGALQMMSPEWFLQLKETAIITPHQLEFERLFGIKISAMSVEDKIMTIQTIAKQYKIVILLKAVIDIISNGTETFVVEGGNAGLTKGGSGDILAGLTASLYTKTDAVIAAMAGSYMVKKAADELYKSVGYWYNMSNLIEKIPVIMKEITL